MIGARSSPTVVLFDIDGTLLHAGGAGRRAIARALDSVCQAGHAVDTVDMRGMTDLVIFRDALAHAGRAPDPTLVELLCHRYLEFLEEEVAISQAYRVLPGVGPLLEALAVRPAIALGLGTGNLELGARVKLGRGGLAGYFSFGGFGSDHEDRTQILRIGAERGARLLGCALGDCRVVVIGDTPRDVAAGLAIGAEVIAVGTGGYALATLLAAGATCAVADLSDPAALNAVLGLDDLS